MEVVKQTSRLGEVARWTLIVVIVVLAFVGFLLTRGTAVKHVRGVGADGALHRDHSRALWEAVMV